MRHLTSCVLLALAVGCSPGSERQDSFANRDSADISIVESGGEDRTLSLSLVHLANLAPPDSALTPVPWAVAGDPENGRIYAIDWTSPRVVVFDANGGFVGTWGREGGGPGEFRNPVALDVLDDGELVVFDAGRQVLSRWSHDGTLLREERAPADYWGHGLAITDSGHVMVTAVQLPDGAGLVQKLVSATSSRVRTLYELQVEYNLMDLPGLRTPAPRILSPSIVWTGRGEQLHVLSGPQYRIDRYEAGELKASYRRNIPPIPVTEALATSSLEVAPGQYGGFLRRFSITPAQLVRAVGHESQVSPVQHLTSAPGETLWVTRTTDGIRPSVVDVFDGNGAYVGTIPVPGIPVAFAADSVVVVLGTDGVGGSGLTLYRMAR